MVAFMRGRINKQSVSFTPYALSYFPLTHSNFDTAELVAGRIPGIPYLLLSATSYDLAPLASPSHTPGITVSQNLHLLPTRL